MMSFITWVISGCQHFTSQRRGRKQHFSQITSISTTFHVEISSCFNGPGSLCDSVEITEPQTQHASWHSAAGRAAIELSAVGHVRSVRDVLVTREARSSRPGAANTSGPVRSLSKRIKKCNVVTYKYCLLCLEIETTHNGAQLAPLLSQLSCPNTRLHCCQTGLRHF